MMPHNKTFNGNRKKSYDLYTEIKSYDLYTEIIVYRFDPSSQMWTGNQVMLRSDV